MAITCHSTSSVEASTASAHVEDDALVVTFEKPQRAVTPGQALVCYDDHVVLGGGWIL